MPVSEAKKKANAKWNKKNIVTLSCSASKAEAEAFKAYAAKLGRTPNSLIKEFILSCINSSEYNSNQNE